MMDLYFDTDMFGLLMESVQLLTVVSLWFMWLIVEFWLEVVMWVAFCWV